RHRQVWIDIRQCTLHLRLEHTGWRIGHEEQSAYEMRTEFQPLHQRVRIVDRLRERHIEHRTRGLVEREPRELRVANDSDDAVRADVLGQIEAEMLIEGIL